MKWQVCFCIFPGPSSQLGDIFTIHVAGKCMTFVTDPEDFPLFFQNKNVDFQQAVQPYTMGVGVCVCVCERERERERETICGNTFVTVPVH